MLAWSVGSTTKSETPASSALFSDTGPSLPASWLRSLSVAFSMRWRVWGYADRFFVLVGDLTERGAGDVLPLDEGAHAVGDHVEAHRRVRLAQRGDVLCKEVGAVGDALGAGVAEVRDLVAVALEEAGDAAPDAIVAIQAVDEDDHR